MPIISTSALDLTQDYLKLYGHHVIGNRAVPEGRDGLKPVQRRIIWAMYNLKATSELKAQKNAVIAGETHGKLHPHGTSSIDSAMVNMSHTRTRANLIVGMGNWGSMTNPPAAARYIQGYLSEYALTMLDADELACVPTIPTYTGKDVEPLWLPARFPHLLIDGVYGIAYGAAVSIPPMTPAWVIQQMEKLPKPVPVEETFHCYGGKLLSLDSEWVTTGSGRALFRPTFRMEESTRTLFLTSDCPGLNMTKTMQGLRDLDTVYAVSNLSMGRKIAISIIFRKNAVFQEEAKAIIKKLRGSESYSFLYVSRDSEEVYQPTKCSPIQFLEYWKNWRLGFEKKVAQYRIDQLNIANGRLDLMIRVVLHRDKLLQVFKKAKSTEQMNTMVCKVLKCTAVEATYVLDQAMRRLSTLALKELEAKVAANKKLIITEQKVIKNPNDRFWDRLTTSFQTIQKVPSK